MEESDLKIEQQKKKALRFVFSFLFVLIIGLIGIAFLLFQDNGDLKNEINRKDSLIKNTRVLDSTLFSQQKKNKSIVEKYISDCNIVINGKKVTTEELIVYMNKQIDVINTLNRTVTAFADSLAKCRFSLSVEKQTSSFYKKKYVESTDSFEVYKIFYDLAKRNLKTDFSIKKDDSSNNQTISLKMPPESPLKDSLFLYKSLYKFAHERYGIQYEYTFKDGTINATNKSDKLDSALIIWEYYKNRLKKDKNGDWIIKTPLFYKKPK